MNIHTDEQPPSVAERAEDERYAREFETLVVTFRTALDTMSPQGLAIQTSRVCGCPSYALSYEQPVIYFCDRWGFPAVLRALAKAIEQPAHILGDLEGD